MSSIVIKGNTSGQIELAAPDVAGSTTLTLPANTGNVITTGDSGTITQGMIGSGVASTGPAFSAYITGGDLLINNQEWTKVTFNTTRWNIDNCFDTTNYRFTPNVAGYYLLHYNVATLGNLDTGSRYFYQRYYKNGGIYQAGMSIRAYDSTTILGDTTLDSSCMVYANGTTDYFEAYVYISSTNPLIDTNADRARFEAFLVRAA